MADTGEIPIEVGKIFLDDAMDLIILDFPVQMDKKVSKFRHPDQADFQLLVNRADLREDGDAIRVVLRAPSSLPGRQVVADIKHGFGGDD